MPDGYVLMGVMTTGFGKVDPPPEKGTVWISKDRIEEFKDSYNWDVVEKEDGSIQVNYFRITK